MCLSTRKGEDSRHSHDVGVIRLVFWMFGFFALLGDTGWGAWGPFRMSARGGSRCLMEAEPNVGRGRKDRMDDIAGRAGYLAAIRPRGRDVAWSDPSLLALVIGGGLLLRLLLVDRLSPHVDEPASVLAAQMVAERGLPILPSGVLYLQGATLSALLAPLVWLGFGDLDHLAVLRLVSAAAGTVAVGLTYVLGCYLTGRTRLGLLAALCAGLDPANLQWSAHVRPYALLQALSLAIVWVFLQAVADPRRRRLASLVILFWVATFTHVGVILLWPPLLLVTVLIYGRTLWTERRPLALAVALCLVGPFALVAVNHAFGGTSQTAAGSTPGMAFVGNHLLAARAWTHPSLAAWRDLFDGIAVADLLPVTLAAASGLLLGQWVFAAPGATCDGDQRRVQGMILALYWVPILLVATFAVERHPRYFVNLHPLGYLLLVATVQTLLQARPAIVTQRVLLRAVGGGLVTFMLVAVISGAGWRLTHPRVDADPRPALAYVAAHHREGDPILVAMPPAAYLILGSRVDLQFLAGPETSNRALRYVRRTPDGRSIDYWAGMEAIASTAALCDQLADQPESWLVVDRVRLRSSWAYRGPMADVISGATDEVLARPDGQLVLRAKPPVKWTGLAHRQCTAAGVSVED